MQIYQRRNSLLLCFRNISTEISGILLGTCAGNKRSNMLARHWENYGIYQFGAITSMKKILLEFLNMTLVFRESLK